jgi:hypothetical protein
MMKEKSLPLEIIFIVKILPVVDGILVLRCLGNMMRLGEINALFGGRCEEKREENGRVCQLGNFQNKSQNSDFVAVFPQCTGFETLDFSAVSCDF